MKADVKSDEYQKQAIEWAIKYFSDDDCTRDLGPADDIEATALLMVWENLRRSRNPDFFCRFISHIISNATNPGQEPSPVDWDPRSTARGLCQFAGTLMSQGHSLPEPLHNFIINFLDDPNLENFASASGRKKRPNAFRDLRIIVAINHIVRTWEFRATRARRKDTAKGLSAASIVKDALEKSGVYLTEDAVNKIWNETKEAWGHIPDP